MTDQEQDEQFYRDTESIAFPKLNDYQLSLLEPLGERRVMKRGDILFKAGQRDLGLAIVLRGEIEGFETRDGTEYNLATAHERDFVGDVSMLQGTSILGTARVTSDEAEILHIPAAELRRAASGTTMTDYRTKFERTAQELEDHARELEYRPRLVS